MARYIYVCNVPHKNSFSVDFAIHGYLRSWSPELLLCLEKWGLASIMSDHKFSFVNFKLWIMRAFVIRRCFYFYVHTQLSRINLRNHFGIVFFFLLVSVQSSREYTRSHIFSSIKKEERKFDFYLDFYGWIIDQFYFYELVI